MARTKTAAPITAQEIQTAAAQHAKATGAHDDAYTALLDGDQFDQYVDAFDAALYAWRQAAFDVQGGNFKAKYNGRGFWTGARIQAGEICRRVVIGGRAGFEPAKVVPVLGRMLTRHDAAVATALPAAGVSSTSHTLNPHDVLALVQKHGCGWLLTQSQLDQHAYGSGDWESNAGSRLRWSQKAQAFTLKGRPLSPAQARQAATNKVLGFFYPEHGGYTA